MAENLLFRGGNTADVNNSATTINDREIVIDTQTNSIVLGSAKQRTVMNGGDQNVAIGTGSSSEPLTVVGAVTGFSNLSTPLVLGTTGTNTNGGHSNAEGVSLSFQMKRSDGGTANGAFIKSVAEADLGASWPTALTFGTRRYGSTPVEHVRIESTGKTHFKNNIGVGVAPGLQAIRVQQSAVTGAPSRSSALYLENNGNCEIQLVGNPNNDCQIRFGTDSNSFKGALEYQLDNDALVAYTGGGNVSEKFRIASNGLATFASGVTGDYFATNTTAGFFNFYRNQGGSSAINTAWGDTGGAQNILFYNDGSATFAGQALIGSGTAGASKVRIDPTGYVNIQSTASAGEALRIYDNSSTQKITLRADGTATFGGSIDTAGNVVVGTDLRMFNGVLAINHVSDSNIDHIWHDENSNTFIFNSDTTRKDAGATGNVKANSLEAVSAADGIIMASPNGTRYRLTVANDGTLSTTAV